jgi:hypothetical protein
MKPGDGPPVEAPISFDCGLRWSGLASLLEKLPTPVEVGRVIVSASRIA